MRRLVKSHAAWVTIGSSALYWASSLFIPSELLRQAGTGIALGVATVIVVTWAKETWHAFRSGGDTPEEQVLIAVFVTWFAIVLGRIYAAIFYMLDAPTWLSDSPISGFLAFAVAIAGYLFITAPGLMPDAPPGRYKFHLAIALILGILTAAFMIGITGGYTIDVSQSVVRNQDGV